MCQVLSHVLLHIVICVLTIVAALFFLANTIVSLSLHQLSCAIQIPASAVIYETRLPLTTSLRQIFTLLLWKHSCYKLQELQHCFAAQSSRLSCNDCMLVRCSEHSSIGYLLPLLCSNSCLHLHSSTKIELNTSSGSYTSVRPLQSWAWPLQRCLRRSHLESQFWHPHSGGSVRSVLPSLCDARAEVAVRCQEA